VTIWTVLHTANEDEFFHGGRKEGLLREKTCQICTQIDKHVHVPVARVHERRRRRDTMRATLPHPLDNKSAVLDGMHFRARFPPPRRLEIHNTHLQSDLSVQSSPTLILIPSEIQPCRNDLKLSNPIAELDRTIFCPQCLFPFLYHRSHTQTHISQIVNIREHSGKTGKCDIFAPAVTNILQVKFEQMASMIRCGYSHSTIQLASNRKKLHSNFGGKKHKRERERERERTKLCIFLIWR